MITAICSLILNLLMFASVTDQANWPIFTNSPKMAFVTGFLFYLVLLAALFTQNRIWRTRLKKLIPQGEIAFCFLLYYFFFGAQRLLIELFWPFGPTAALLFGLCLYFTAQYVSEDGFKRGNYCSALQVIQLVLPFSLPFILFVFLGDIEKLIPYQTISVYFSLPHVQITETLISLLIDVTAIATLLIFIPPCALFLWGCKPLDNPSLSPKLDALCKRATFRHGGFRLWQVLPQACTAAILGIVPRFRYVLFTPRLLSLLSPQAIEAVLAHEIGHSKRHHLLFYPFILGGVGIFVTALAFFILSIFYHDGLVIPITLSPLEETTLQLAIFSVTLFVIALYLRLVFGYFSRHFEREADLHVIEMKLPADAMIEALDTLAIASGNIHDEPNWHHHSIRERINFLQKAAAHPALIQKHHAKVKKSLLLFFTLLGMATSYAIVQFIRFY